MFSRVRAALCCLPIAASVATAATISSSSSSSSCDPEPSFSPKEFRSFKIQSIKDLSHNTKAFVVSLPSKEHRMGAPTASCVMIKGPSKEDGSVVAKPYTPTSLDSDLGSFELVIKSYPTGNVSKYLHTLSVGDSIEVKGPFAKLKYERNMKKKIGMVAGGTGITPMLQIIQESLKDPLDTTELVLVFANVSEDDILLKERIDRLAAANPRLKVHYVLSHPKDQSAFEKKGGFTGHVNTAYLSSKLPTASDSTMILVCGPPGFMEVVSGNKSPDYKQGEVSGALKELGYKENMVYKF